MVGLGDIGKRAKEIGMLVANAEFERAIIRTIDFAEQFGPDKSSRHEAILHSARFTEMTRERRRNVITAEEFDQRRSQCMIGVLELVDDIVDMSAGLEPV